MDKIQNTAPHKRRVQDSKKDFGKRLYKALNQPLSRRMAATKMGFPDQTYMVTQFIKDWIKQGKAQVIGAIRCTRSGRKVEAVTTNRELFKPTNENQLELF